MMSLRPELASTTFISPIRSWHHQREVDVIIVGAGIAGLATALRLPTSLRLAIVTKGVLGESNTRYAQGGFAAPIGPTDSIDLHVADTLVAGAGLSDAAPVRALVSRAAEAVAWLIAQGTTFDRSADDEIALGKEAAHSRHRILHAGGDATGAEIERALVARLRERPNTTILDETTALDLVVDADGRCRGVIVTDFTTPERTFLTASETILANGGAGQLWDVTSNPAGATGDGMAMAIRAGVTLADLEFAQFHPTVLIVPGAEGFLISEAVRGEGAQLRSSRGHRFMPDIDPRAELAPRDIVARAIHQQTLQDGLPFVLLDVRHLDPDFLRQRFPTITATLDRLDVDFANHLVPVAPAAHYFMGGIAAGSDGQTSMPGLRAIGEVSATGVHGANRLASNSLLEGLVFGLETADAIASTPLAPADGPLPISDPLDDATTASAFSEHTIDNLRAQLQQTMTDRVAVIRSEDSLASAAEELADIAAIVARIPVTSQASADLRNLARLAVEVTASARNRHESRGGHYREDFPDRDDALDGQHQLVHPGGTTATRTFGTIAEAVQAVATS